MNLFSLIAFLSVISGPGKKIPVPVQEAFQKQYPTAQSVEWEKEGDAYEVEFVTSGKEMSVEYTAEGTLIQTEMTIEIAALPAAAKSWIEANLAGKKISETTKIIDADGTISYEAEIKHKDYIFDASGKLLNP